MGKTGTAQNPHGKDHSLFVAFAPRENPKIAIGLMVENGGWGASWAAPIGTLMIEKYLNDTVARKDLEKRMFDGVVYPPHYKVGTEFEEKTAKKDSSKTVSKNKKEDNKKKKDKKEVSEKKKSSDTETKKPAAEKKSEKGASEKPETIEKNSPKKGDKDKKKKVENKSDKKSDSSKVKTTKKETVKSKKNTPQKDIVPAQIKKDATQIDSTK